MTRSDARAYLRGLAMLHLAPLMMTLGGALAMLGLRVGVWMAVVGGVLWVLSLSYAFLRAVRRNRGQPLFGRDSITEDSNWLTGWGPIPEAAEAVGRDPQRIRRLAKSSVWASAVCVALWFVLPALSHLSVS